MYRGSKRCSQENWNVLKGVSVFDDRASIGCINLLAMAIAKIANHITLSLYRIKALAERLIVVYLKSSLYRAAPSRLPRRAILDRYWYRINRKGYHSRTSINDLV